MQDDSAAYDNVKRLYGDHPKKGTHPTLDEFLGVLRSEAQGFPRCLLLWMLWMSAPRSREPEVGLLGALKTLSSTVNLFVTSRDLASIAADFRGTKQLDIYARDDDGAEDTLKVEFLTSLG